MMFPFVQPENFEFEFNLKYFDHRLATFAVLRIVWARGLYWGLGFMVQGLNSLGGGLCRGLYRGVYGLPRGILRL